MNKTAERQNRYGTKSFTISGALKINSVFHCIKKEAN